MPPPPSLGVFSTDVRLRPDELVAAWRTDLRRLVLQTREPLRVGRRVAARITVADRGVAATITGRVSSVSRQESIHRVELVPDEMRLRALERLVAVARGAAAAYPPRSPRLLAALPAIVYGPGGPTYMTTFSVSENGCGLAWSGPVATSTGAHLEIRLGAGSRAVTFRSVVCWTGKAGASSAVGVRFVTGARDAWALMLTEAARLGAPPA